MPMKSAQAGRVMSRQIEEIPFFNRLIHATGLAGLG